MDTTIDIGKKPKRIYSKKKREIDKKVSNSFLL